MNCEIYHNALEDYWEGELDEKATARVSSHVFACEDCAARIELLKQERKIYAHYLFDVEPPDCSLEKFQAKLEAEKVPLHAGFSQNSSFWRIYSFGLKNLSLAPIFAAALVVFGVGYVFLYFGTGEKPAETQYSARTEIKNGELPAAEIGETNAANNFPPESKNMGEFKARKIAENKNNKEPLIKKIISVDFKRVAVSNKTFRKPAFFVRDDKFSAESSRLNKEARAQRLKFENLKIETARHIEKVELLLRTFRNARASAGSQDVTFDVSYEKGQARKLLEKNARLRQIGEPFGTNRELAILSRVEPYLLEIANLDEKPSPGKIEVIKERVADQNIIASLQIY